MLVCFVQESWDSYCFSVSCESLYLVLGCFVQESFDLVIVGFAGYAVLLIVLCFEACLYIALQSQGFGSFGVVYLCPCCLWVGVLSLFGFISSSCSTRRRNRRRHSVLVHVARNRTLLEGS